MKKRPTRTLVDRKAIPPKTSANQSKLSVKQRQFIANKLKGQSSAKAAREAGYSESVSRKADQIVGGSRKLHDAFEDILEKAGITDELLAQRIAEGLDATVVKPATRYSKREVLVDFTERRLIAELVCKLKGYLVHKHEVDTGPTLAELLEESLKDE